MAFIQDIFAEAENVATLDAVFGTNVTAGNFLVLGSAIYDADNTNPTPTGGGTWSTTTAPTQQNTSNAHICHCANATGGATTVTYAPGAGAYLSINAAEFSGLETSSVIDVQTSNGSASSTTPTSGTTGTTAQADELVIAVLCVAAVPVAGGFGIDVPATTGYTNIEVKQRDTGALDANGFSMDYKIVSATGTQAAAWGTLSAANPWIAKIATFKLAAAGGSSVTLTPSAGNIAWNGNLATLKTLYKANPAVGNVAWNGNLATLKTLIKLGPSAGNVAWNGGLPTTKVVYKASPAVGNLAWNGAAATLKTLYRVSPLAGLVQWSGQLPTVDSRILVTLSPFSGNLSWNGGLPTAKTVYKISPAAGAINWNGGLPTLSFPQNFAWTAVSRASTSWNAIARDTQTWTRIQRDGSTLWTTRERPYDEEV